MYSGSSGNGSSSPQLLTHVNNTLFFTAIDDTHGRELWESDGTEAGTVLVSDIKEGINSSDIRYMVDVAGVLFFKNTNILNGSELWKHDPGSGHTVKVKEMKGMTDIGNVYAAVDDMLFFQGSDGTAGSELWKSDGSEEGTELVKDINPGSDRSSPESLTNVAGTLFFSAHDDTHGRELWKSDGTANGTVMVKEITEGEVSTQLRCFTAVKDTLFFFVQTNFHISSLWISDGTEKGTIDTNMQVDPGTCPVSMNGQLYLYGWEGMEYGSELYRYNLSDNIPASPVAIVSIDETKVTLTWNSVSGAEGYNLVYAPYPYAGPETISSFDLENTTSLSVDLWQGAAFYVAIEAYNSDSVSEYSNIELFILE
ncbi:MAG: ELWxxDGT repeat protein [Methylococcaceae bacterium]